MNKLFNLEKLKVFFFSLEAKLRKYWEENKDFLLTPRVEAALDRILRGPQTITEKTAEVFWDPLLQGKLHRDVIFFIKRCFFSFFNWIGQGFYFLIKAPFTLWGFIITVYLLPSAFPVFKELGDVFLFFQNLLDIDFNWSQNTWIKFFMYFDGWAAYFLMNHLDLVKSLSFLAGPMSPQTTPINNIPTVLGYASVNALPVISVFCENLFIFNYIYYLPEMFVYLYNSGMDIEPIFLTNRRSMIIPPFLSFQALIDAPKWVDYFYDLDDNFIFFRNLSISSLGIEFVFGTFTFFGFFFVLTVVASFFWINSLGLYGSFVLTTIGLSMFWISGFVAAFFVFAKNYSYQAFYGKWFSLMYDLEVGFDFNFDTLSMSFGLLVLTIAFFINIYTFAYFRYEPNVSRLILFIDVFVVSMVLLVTAGNVILMYLGWELIGITSFFLINFWATRMGTVKASYKAFTFNKISDCCILFGCLLIFNMFDNINILHINNTISTHAQTDIKLLFSKWPALHSLTYLFMTAAFIKSAQFGFHIWLPDSMEAPVPASALIHSATLVSAGIFLILRFYPLFEYSPFARTYIIFFGSLTALFGGMCSIFQTDVKRLLAYSTISHCGVLMFLTFFKNPDLVIIYLYVHGFFKAIIFMCMGHVIRFANNYQDMRRMGGFYKYLPFEALMSFVALMNLGGVSFTWGYYMKHFLLVESSPESQFNLFCFIMVLLGSLCGLVYSYKLYYYVFFDFKKARKHVYYKLGNNLNKNYYYTNASLASNAAISGLTIFAYFLCGYLIIKYLSDHNIHFDSSYFSNVKTELKNFNTDFFLNLFFYINWAIVFVVVFIIFNNWKNTIDPAFKIKFFVFSWTFIFFFYIFYSILSL